MYCRLKITNLRAITAINHFSFIIEKQRLDHFLEKSQNSNKTIDFHFNQILMTFIYFIESKLIPIKLGYSLIIIILTCLNLNLSQS